MAYALEGIKWATGGYGTSGGQVTWSFATHNYVGQTYTFDAVLNDTMKTLVRHAFARWESVANIDFVESGDAFGNAIRIGLDYIDGPGRVVGEASYRYQYGTPGRLTKAEIRFENESWSWSEQTLTNSSGTNFYVVALHEIGHTIGLGHVNDQLEVMNNTIQPGINDLQAGDIAGAQVIYGAATSTNGLQPVHRFYERSTGEHFYTTSSAEKTMIMQDLLNYTYEGAQWSVPAKAADTLDVFRFYDMTSRTHHFTASVVERDAIIKNLPQFNYEGVAFQSLSPDSQAPGQIALERFFNTATGVHHLALPGEDVGIRQGLAGPNWIDEGLGFKVHTMTADVLI